MELNYSLKTAETALKDIAPDTLKFIKNVLTSRGGVEDKSSVLAITRLCEIINCSNKNYVKMRNRRLTKNIVVVLANLATFHILSNESEFHRTSFLTDIGANDFSILKYWGFIENGSKKGWWKITKKGMGFVFQRPGFAYAYEKVTQLGGHKGNYTLNRNSKAVTCSDIVGTDEWSNLVSHNLIEGAVNFIENN